jgi:glycosylphosphatidylinositol transamidase (GPIT) subunit GPI8
MYHLLRENGVPDKQIVHMSFDDAAMAKENPARGKLVNEDLGIDVYKDCNIDFKGDDVNIENFTNVMLSGGSGHKTLESNDKSNVFVYINSIGGEGVLSFPNFEYLYGDELKNILMKMKKKKLFYQMLIYLESSFSGSLFDGDVLPSNLSVLAVTSTNKKEVSFATHCHPFDRIIGKNKHPVSLGACLADSFSFNMMHVAENNDLKKLTIKEHIEMTKNLTHNSHVSFFGDSKLLDLPLSEFFSFKKGEESERA